MQPAGLGWQDSEAAVGLNLESDIPTGSIPCIHTLSWVLGPEKVI